MKIKSKANAALGLHANPVGDAGGHDGTGRDSDDGGVSAKTLFTEIPSYLETASAPNTLSFLPTGLYSTA
jgi:hypothetical protein